MKFLIILLSIPYLFLATSVVEIENTNKEYKCIIEKIENVHYFIRLTKVYYQVDMMGNEYIILPKFNAKGRVIYSNCGDKTFLVGTSDHKIGDKLYMYTKMDSIRLFGLELFREESVHVYGTGW